MGSMFGGGSDDSSSREMIQMQKDEAAKAEAKEQERQARLKSGLASIRGAFHGSPVMGTRQVAVPAGFRIETGPATTTRVLDPRGGSSDRGQNRRERWITKTIPGTTRRVATPAGTRTESYDTGKRTGGIGNDFFNNFKQGILDFYTPQVARKYSDAQKETTYRLADAGTHVE